jgi:hypothetical protein
LQELVKKPKDKYLGMPKRRWEDVIKMCVKEMGLEDVD